MLDSKQCEAFFTVAETGSFEHASQRLCITSSAVTLRVQALEKHLGQLLLIRGRPCVLTQSGLHLFEYLQHSKRLEQNLLYSLTGKSESNYFKTTIATNADSLATWLLPALKDVLIQERIMVEFNCADQSHTYSLLENGTVNACISIESEAMKGCNAIYLGSMRYKMVSTPLFQKKWFKNGITRESLRTAPAIIFNHKDHTHFDVLEKMFGLTKGTYPCHLIPSSESFVTAIQLGLGYGMVPEFQLEQAFKDKSLVEILPEAETDIALYWHHWNQQSAPLQALTTHIVQKAKIVLR